MAEHGDDVALFDAWARGDNAAGDALFARHFDGVYGFFFRKAGVESDDLTQRTFLSCLEAHHRFRGASTFRAFLYGIARNQLLRFLRDRKPVDGGEAPSQLPMHGTSPESRAQRGEAQRIVLAAVQRLPLEYQMALELRYWEDMTVPEIAAVTDVPEGTVKARLSRSRRLLRDAIAEVSATRRSSDSTREVLKRWLESLRFVPESG